jgi:hypothetical protein
MAGRLGVVAALLTTAFHEQFYDIGWLHLQLGRVSLHWTKAYQETLQDLPRLQLTSGCLPGSTFSGNT